MSELHLPPDIGVPVPVDHHTTVTQVTPVTPVADNNVNTSTSVDSKAPLIILSQLQEWVAR